MIIKVSSTKSVQVLGKTETPWNMNGTSGTTYRLAVSIDGDIEKIKAVDKKIFDSVQLGKNYYIDVDINVSNGSVREPKISGLRMADK